MDAPEDREIKLQRASGDFVKEFSARLPALLWKPSTERGKESRTPRRRTPAAKAEKLVGLLEPFQEWPQLLDPHLQSLLPPLVDAFLAYLVNHRDHYASKAAESNHLYPLPRAICRLLYTFCKVRGVKVISRFLNNEPKYLQPLLRAFIAWDETPQEEPADVSQGDIPRRLVWEERYVMLIWLSHLLLAPFDLSSLSSDDIPIPHRDLEQLAILPTQAPVIARSILSLSLYYVNAPGKEREAATVLLARLALRGDMQSFGILGNLTDWAFSIIEPVGDAEPLSVYTCIGVLSFLSRLAASGQVEEFGPLIVPVFGQILGAVQGESQVSKIVQSSAIARKMIIKILRSLTLMAISLNERGDGSLSDDQVSFILEDTIDHFLVALADKDTPVRFAASKSLSIITLKLEPEMATEVIEAITGSLEENILYQKQDGTIVTPLEARLIGINALKRNLSAVDSQRWQGLILTLGHLLFRRAPPTHQLPTVLQPLVSGLGFEQRSSTGSSVGTGVRDASCFGIWALSRKYTTQELLALDAQAINTPTDQSGVNTLQILATELVCAACVDPSGNIRRGASAALQELIGRHPNTIAEGISLVQVVDYHAVARRSRAMIDVAKATADLSHIYWRPLLNSLMDWRGIGSPDAESRRHAAKAIGILSTQKAFATMGVVLHQLVDKLMSLPHNEVEARHGCFLALSATVEAFVSSRETSDYSNSPEAEDIARQLAGVWEILSSPASPTKDDLTLQVRRPELTAEAASCLIQSLALATSQTSVPRVTVPSPELLDKARTVLLLCISRGEDTSISAAAGAWPELFSLLSFPEQDETIQGWFSHINATRKLPTARGEILVLGAIFRKIPLENGARQSIVEELLRVASKEELIEKRVVAVKSLTTGVLPYIDVTPTIADNLVEFLNDYTTNRRGDIGSLVRLEAIQAANTVLQKKTGTVDRSHAQEIVGCLCRLAAEKLDKVRLQAWLCLQSFWESAPDFPPLHRQYEHFSHVSSVEYFLQLLELQSVEWLRLPLHQGFATSAVVGAEGLVRSSRLALAYSLNNHGPEERQAVAIAILRDLLVILTENLQDDRYAVPTLELIAWLLDGYVSFIPEGSEPSFRKLFVAVQKAHFKTANVARLEAAVKIYASLSRLEALRAEVLKKMTGMLLHPFPRVRNVVAEYLFMETRLEVVKCGDWTRQSKELKGDVEGLREALGCR